MENLEKIRGRVTERAGLPGFGGGLDNEPIVGVPQVTAEKIEDLIQDYDHATGDPKRLGFDWRERLRSYIAEARDLVNLRYTHSSHERLSERMAVIEGALLEIASLLGAEKDAPTDD